MEIRLWVFLIHGFWLVLRKSNGHYTIDTVLPDTYIITRMGAASRHCISCKGVALLLSGFVCLSYFAENIIILVLYHVRGPLNLQNFSTRM